MKHLNECTLNGMYVSNKYSLLMHGIKFGSFTKFIFEWKTSIYVWGCQPQTWFMYCTGCIVKNNSYVWTHVQIMNLIIEIWISPRQQCWLNFHIHKSRKCTIKPSISTARVMNHNIHNAIYRNAETYFGLWGLGSLANSDDCITDGHWQHFGNTYPIT